MFSDRSSRLVLYNSIFLIVIFCLLLGKTVIEGGYVNFVYWPGANVLSVGVLSFFVIRGYKFKNAALSLKNSTRHVLYALLFGVALFVLSGLVTLVFERFFRFDEHYSFTILVEAWQTNWFGWVNGFVIYILYMTLLTFEAQRTQLKITKQLLLNLEKDIVNSNLETLRAELNPHFLYNAMNSISMTVRLGQTETATTMIANLNDLLRILLTKKEEAYIPLSEEITLLEKYVAIESIRFEDKLKIEMNFEDATLQAMVPQLILQPLVENAFKHGTTDTLAPQRITVTSEISESLLILKVYNSMNENGQVQASRNVGTGVGLNNVVSRLRHLYGYEFKFQIEMLNDGMEFRIIIPCKL